MIALLDVIFHYEQACFFFAGGGNIHIVRGNYENTA